MPRIYTAQPLAAGNIVQLEEGPARHLAGALRLKAGAAITLFNGEGGEYPAVLSRVEKRCVEAELGEQQLIEREPSLPVHLGIALSRGERMDWIVQKTTELGVTEITPLLSERSEVRLQGERREKKLEHWRKVAIAACEQCGRNRLPQIQPIQKLEDWISSVEAGLKLVLHHRTESAVRDLPRPSSVALLIGPEGGLAEGEINNAIERGDFSPLALGPRIMRTETAPLAALSILQSHWGDMV